MSNYGTASGLRNGAINKISGGSTRGVAASKDIKQTAAENTSAADNSDQVNSQIVDESKYDERKMLWYSLGISIAVIVIFVMVIKFKIIKL